MIPALLVALGCLLSPVGTDLSGRGSTVIVARYRAPECPYCAGHRTVDFSVASGPVRAPVSGRVVFAGEVVGVVYVSIEPFAEPSVVITVGGVAVPEVDAGASVARGARIGVAEPPGPVTLSVRRRVAGGEAVYLDPTPWIGRRPARLVPPGGRGARPAGGALVCRVVGDR